MNKNDPYLDEIYDSINALMAAECWEFINKILTHLVGRTWRTDVGELQMYLNATLPGKDKLPARATLLDNCKRLYPNSELWKGLE